MIPILLIRKPRFKRSYITYPTFTLLFKTRYKYGLEGK